MFFSLPVILGKKFISRLGSFEAGFFKSLETDKLIKNYFAE